jgi:hypothetical protein
MPQSQFPMALRLQIGDHGELTFVLEHGETDSQAPTPAEVMHFSAGRSECSGARGEISFVEVQP